MPSTVVGAAVFRGGRILAARRTGPADLAGRWELPGGKVEPGEDPREALAREVLEELDLLVHPGPLIGRVSLDGGRRLAVYACEPSGEPLLGDDHDDLCWLRPDELDDVDWLDADRELLPKIVAHLDRETRQRAARQLLIGAIVGFAIAVIGVAAGIATAVQVKYSCGNEIDSLIKLVCTDKTYPDLWRGLLIAVASAVVGLSAGFACLLRRRRVVT